MIGSAKGPGTRSAGRVTSQVARVNFHIATGNSRLFEADNRLICLIE
ncbi:hypothetical protein PAMC26577_11325 [Caballeronia sordidicola]|uniref:Uncharacterized protein n=1 Tax=Caballeronia sordidicola TaxID=196367 RepID=A0A242MXW0_CABSO|nr:hypothetical protein PAMC26577_11325 [Caballeronia sordidicola]